jgi:hypothetical protein
MGPASTLAGIAANTTSTAILARTFIALELIN